MIPIYRSWLVVDVVQSSFVTLYKHHVPRRSLFLMFAFYCFDRWKTHAALIPVGSRYAWQFSSVTSCRSHLESSGRRAAYWMTRTYYIIPPIPWWLQKLSSYSSGLLVICGYRGPHDIRAHTKNYHSTSQTVAMAPCQEWSRYRRPDQL